MPYTAKIVDDLCFIKSMHTEQINHDPAVTFAQNRLSARRSAKPRGMGPPTDWARSIVTFPPLS
jgi:hypothetical protein